MSFPFPHLKTEHCESKMNPLLLLSATAFGFPLGDTPLPPPPPPPPIEQYVECPKRFEDEDPELAELLGWWGTLDRREQKKLWNQPTVNETPKVGRNEPCPCGSGKKYKQCHGQLA